MTGFEFTFDGEPDESQAADTELEELLQQEAALQEQLNELARQQKEKLGELRQARWDRQDAQENAAKKALAKQRAMELEEEHAALLREEQDKTELLAETAARIKGYELVSWIKSRPFQAEDIVSIMHDFYNGGRGFFNANDMGLGKTFESIICVAGFLRENPEAKVLWLTKSQILLTGGTEREFQRWAPDLKTASLNGSSPKADRQFTCRLLANMTGFTLFTNYESLRTTKELREIDFDYIVMDEVHKLKGGANPGGPTGIWKTVKEYIWRNEGTDAIPVWESKVKYVMMLSGTPMVNRVAELWSYLHIFDPERFPSRRAFEKAFNAYVDFGGKVDTKKILDMCLKDRMIRRTRDEVGIDLPEMDVQDQDIVYNVEQQKVYDQMRTRFYVWLDSQEGEPLTAAAIIAQLTRLRQISVWPVFSQTVEDEYGNERTIKVEVEDSAKVDEAMDLIEEHGDSVIVCCNFNEVFYEIERRCKVLGLTCRMITGKAEHKRELGSVEIDFQQGKVDVLCINTMMGEGMNLQRNPEMWPGGATMLIHLDQWWSPGREDQANARIHRQGADKSCVVKMIYNENSVDAFVRSISEEKAETFGGIMNSDMIRPASDWKNILGGML